MRDISLFGRHFLLYRVDLIINSFAGCVGCTTWRAAEMNLCALRANCNFSRAEWISCMLFVFFILESADMLMANGTMMVDYCNVCKGSGGMICDLVSREMVGIMGGRRHV